MLSKKEIIANAQSVDDAVAPTVYFLIKDEEIVYIGQTRNFGERLSRHKSTKDFDSVFYIVVDDGGLLETEGAYIQKFSPVLNKQTGAPRTPGRATYTPNIKACEWIDAILAARPDFDDSISRAINYALWFTVTHDKDTTTAEQEARE